MRVARRYILIGIITMAILVVGLVLNNVLPRNLPPARSMWSRTVPSEYATSKPLPEAEWDSELVAISKGALQDVRRLWHKLDLRSVRLTLDKTTTFCVFGERQGFGEVYIIQIDNGTRKIVGKYVLPDA